MIYVYNKKLELCGITDKVTAFSFVKRFYEGSTFSGEFPLTDKNRQLIVPQAVIEIPHRFSGIITAVDISGGKITASGRSFDGMLDSRVVWEGKKTDSLLTIIDKNAGQVAGSLRGFERTYVDKSVDCPLLEDDPKKQNLADYTGAVCYEHNFGVFSEINHSNDMIRIYGRYGVDRSVNQTERECVVFSEMYGNVASMGYNYSETGAVNGAIVYADSAVFGNGDISGNIAAFHRIYGEASGYARREGIYQVEPCVHFYVNGAGELKAELDEEKTAVRASDEYKANCIGFTDCVSAAVIVGEDYAKRFDVGDIVTVYSNELGVFTDYRITEISEIYKVGGVKLNVTFGEPIKSIRRLIK